MVRTVRVRLELDRDDFKQGLRDAAAELQAFDGEVKGAGDSAGRTGVELKDTAASARTLGDDARTSARDVDAMGKSVEDAKTSTSKLGDESTKSSGKIRTLDADIKAAKDSVKALAEEYARTKNVDLLPQLSSAAKDLKDLQKLGETMDKTLTQFGAKAGQDTGEAFQASLGGILGTPWLGPILIGSFVAAAAAVVPFVGAVIGGAVLAGIGLAGIGGALALQFEDPRIKASVADLGTWLKTELNVSTIGFVDAFAAGFAALQRNAQPLFDSIRNGLVSLQPYAAQLLARLGEGLAMLGPGLERALSAAGPIVGAIANSLPTLFNGLGIFFDEISKGSKGAAEAITTLVDVISGGLAGAGFVIRGLSDAFDGMVRAVDAVTGVLAKIPLVGGAFKDYHAYVDGVAKSFDAATLSAYDASGAMGQADAAIAQIGLGASLASSDFSKFSQEIKATAQTTDVLAGQMADRLLNSMLASDRAALGFASALTQVSDAVKQNGHQLDIHTAKGQANRSAILAAVAANVQNYDAMIASGASAQDAASAYDSNTNALVHQMRQAGYTQQQIDGLIGKYRNVPKNVDTNIAIYGLTAAIQQLNETIQLINGIHGKTAVITIEEVHRTSYVNSTPPSQVFHGLARGGAVSYASGGVDYRARSGILKPSDPGTILAGEPSTGGEVFVPRRGIADSRGLALANVAAGWHGGRVVQDGPRAGASIQVNSTLTVADTQSGRPVEQMLATWFMSAIRNRDIALKTDDAGLVMVA